MRIGRPTLYQPETTPVTAGYLAQEGLTEEQIAERLGVGITTLSRWKNEHPEFREALKVSKDEADAKVVESLYKQALKGNVTAQIFWLKNRQPAKWRDRQEVETTAITDIALAVKRIVDA
jgi:transcriptional regulator with XRE-family HTH domain